MVSTFTETLRPVACFFLLFNIQTVADGIIVHRYFKFSHEVEAVSENENNFRHQTLINCARGCNDREICGAFHYSRKRQQCFTGNINSKSVRNITNTTVTVFNVYINQRKACSMDFQQYHGSVYSFNNNHMRWDEARKACKMCDAHLVKIEDNDEDTFLVGMLKKLPALAGVIGYWTGGHLVNGTWQWLDGTPLSYTRWGPFEPDHPLRQKSLAYMKWFSFRWASHNSFSSHRMGLGFICERKTLL